MIKIVIALSSLVWAASPQAPKSTEMNYDMPGLQTASVSDGTYSTGATLFYFPDGGWVAFDARGGSVAAAETTLFEDGSYSNWIDGVVFAGGSTLGLSAADGVRQTLFKQRKKTGNTSLFDIIPSVPSAVIYDFAGRKEPGRDKFVVPTSEMGEKLLAEMNDKKFSVGRAGAGTSATFGKIGEPRWGGQGMAFKTYPNGVKIFAAVVMNSLGDVFAADGRNFRDLLAPDPYLNKVSAGGRQNTTLSIVVINVDLDRTQLKRLAIESHSALGHVIRPVATSKDGDILFTVSTKKGPAKDKIKNFSYSSAASEVLLEAVENAVRASNPAISAQRTKQ
jgi:L-aminopeptidase/D-esterase-like protein